MAQQLSVEVGGVWKKVLRPSVEVGGAWKPVKAAWREVSGVWKQVYVSLTVTGIGGFWDAVYGPGEGSKGEPVFLGWQASVSVSATGGLAPYVWAWEVVDDGGVYAGFYDPSHQVNLLGSADPSPATLPPNCVVRVKATDANGTSAYSSNLLITG